jgi:hypothetical protein
MALSGDGPGQHIPNQEDEDPFVSLLGLEDKYELISFETLIAVYRVCLRCLTVVAITGISAYSYYLLWPASCIP